MLVILLCYYYKRNMSRHALNRCWGACEGCDRCWSDNCFHASSCLPHKPMALQELAMINILDYAINYDKLPSPLKTMCDDRKKAVDVATKTWRKQ